MSFASEVKKELLNIEDLNDCCKNALIYGILQGCSEIVITSSGYKLIVKTTILNVIKILLPLLKSRYKVLTGMSYKDEVGLQNRRFYYLEIVDNAEEIISDYKLIPFIHLSRKDDIISKDCCKGSFLRGLFIAKGSINDPRKNCYHLEFTSSKENVIKLCSRLLSLKKIEYSICERRNNYVLYIKKSEDISSTLALIGAKSGVFYFEDQRILRDMHNMANRQMNCDIANEKKCLSNCDAQLHAIEYIRNTGHFEKMSLRLQTIARLREEYPDSSYDELSYYSDNLFGKQLTKSGITHCLRDLMIFYEEIKK